MEEIYQLGKFPFEEENLVAKAERRLGRRLEQENQKRQEVFKLKSVLRYAAAIVGVIVLAAGLAYWFRNKAELALIKDLTAGASADCEIFYNGHLFTYLIHPQHNPRYSTRKYMPRSHISTAQP